MAEPVELEISIASKSITDKTLYGADEPWMYWRLEDNETGKTIIFSSTDEGKTGTTGSSGGCTVSKVLPATYTVTVVADGFEDYSDSIVVDKSHTSFTISLTAVTPSEEPQNP